MNGPDPRVLPDLPDVWGEAVYDAHFIQRWAPGAFGDRETIADVFGFIVEEDEWATGHDGGPIRRTILKAHVIQTVEQARASGAIK